MFSTQITPRDEALINRFHEATQEVGMDGNFHLPPVDRAVLEVGEMASRITIIQILKKLNIKGDDASRLVFSLGDGDDGEPPTEERLHADLTAIFKAKS